jgi:thiamine biosynthesis protein ThiI
MIIVRYGEIGIKSRRTRRRIEARLVANIRRAVKKPVKREFGRIFVDSDSREDAERIAKVFGVVSTSLAIKTTSELEEIISKGAEYAKERIKTGDTFSVRARRTGKHNYTSKDVEAQLGEGIIKVTGAKVNLTKPDRTIYVEVRSGDAYIFEEIIKGVGGLPLGTQETAVTLIRGEVGSSVATWMMMKRGVEPICLYLDSSAFGGGARERALETIKKLAGWKNGRIRTYLVPYGDVLSKIREGGKLACILCKRSMLKIGEAIADKEGAKALVTGENLGRVVSQTMENLPVIDRVATTPVFRPILTMSKNEITELARKINTYRISREGVACSLGPPKYPKPKVELKKVLEAEEEIDMEELIKKAIEGAEIIEVG